MKQIQELIQNMIYSVFNKFQDIVGGNSLLSQFLEQIRGWLDGFLPEQIH
ncbi:MAG: hypothetical protein LBJ12_00920 [Oscillospiraceae bacterium]|nr:hypothetical protein [Oscillospiraceae bacterium]